MKPILLTLLLVSALAARTLCAAEPTLPAGYVEAAREAKASFDRGNYLQAEHIYEGILTELPDNLYVLSNLGVVYFRGGKLKRAEETLRRAIAIAPNDGFCHCTLGIVYYSQQKYDEAVNALTKALVVDPKNASAHNYLAITASQKGWHEVARKELATAIALDPSYADTDYKRLGDFLTPLEKSRLRLLPTVKK